MGKPQNKKNIKYDKSNFNPGTLDKDNIDRLAVDRINNGSFVLDIGCATGFIGEYLIRYKKCRVIGVDISPDEIAVAKTRLSDVLRGDIETDQLFQQLKKKFQRQKFDVILLMSTIEHVKDPDGVLKKLSQLLAKDGALIVTTPNIAHWTMRLSLLKGNFDYTEYGILDRTHLRFFTEKSFLQLFVRNNYVIVDRAIDAVGGGYPRISRFLSKIFPQVFTYQMLLVAKHKSR